MPESVLDPIIHGRLMEMKSNVLEDANIQEEWLHKGAKEFLNEAVYAHVARFKFLKRENTFGLIAFGDVMPDPTSHMSSITGWLTRNFIRCRVATLDMFIEADDEDLLTMSAVCIPNFFIGLPLADWKLSSLADNLLQRKLNGKQTFLWSVDEKQMQSKYGVEMISMLTRDYVKVRPE